MNDVTDKVIGILEKIGEATQQAYPVIRQEYVYLGFLDPITKTSLYAMILSMCAFLLLAICKGMAYLDYEDEACIRLGIHMRRAFIIGIICAVIYILSVGVARIIAPNYMFIQHLINQM